MANFRQTQTCREEQRTEAEERAFADAIFRPEQRVFQDCSRFVDKEVVTLQESKRGLGFR